jgi:predicted branched-subunit amino acid permease
VPASDLRRHAAAGARSVTPMLVGVAPFGLVAGASPVTGGLGVDVAVGLSVVVFAGASQLAAAEVLADGGSAFVAVLAAWTINLRMLLYSASLAPYFSRERLARRLGVAYLLTDQAYAVSITRWRGDDPADAAPGTRAERLAHYLGAGLLLWVVWQICTVVGAVIGGALPEDAPVGFAVPLAFLVLLVPTLVGRPAVVAAVAGGLAAIVAGSAGAGPLSIIAGSVTGVVAGALVDRDGPPAMSAGGGTVP